MTYPQPPEELTPQQLALARHIEMSPKQRTWITLAVFAVAALVIGVIAVFTRPTPQAYHPVPFSCSQEAQSLAPVDAGGQIAPLCGQSPYAHTLPPQTGDG